MKFIEVCTATRKVTGFDTNPVWEEGKEAFINVDHIISVDPVDEGHCYVTMAPSVSVNGVAKCTSFYSNTDYSTVTWAIAEALGAKSVNDIVQAI